MSKTPSGNAQTGSPSSNKSASATASSTKSGAATPSTAASSTSGSSSAKGGPGANGASAASSPNLSSTTPTSNWAKIAAGANKPTPAAQPAASSTPTPAQDTSRAATPASNASLKSNQPSRQSSSSGHGRKASSMNAEAFSSSAKALPIKQADSGIAFGNVNDSSSLLSSSPAQPPLPASSKVAQFGSLPNASDKAGSGSASSSRPSTSAGAAPAPPANSAANVTTASAKPDTNGKAVTGGKKIAIGKVDFNSFFQGGGSNSPPQTPAQEPVPAPTNASTTAKGTPSVTVAGSTLQPVLPAQNSQPASRRASTYDNALSPRAMAAQLPQQHTPVGGPQAGQPMHHTMGGPSARPFSPASRPSGFSPASPSYAPANFGSQHQMPGQPYPPQGYNGKPNGMPGAPSQMQQGGPQQGRQQGGQQPGQSPYMQTRGAPGQMQHQHRASLGPGSPRVQPGQQNPQMQQNPGFYAPQGYAQWQQQQSMQYPYYGNAPYGGYAPPQHPGQQARPGLPQQHSSYNNSVMGQSNPSSPAPGPRPSLPASGPGSEASIGAPGTPQHSSAPTPPPGPNNASATPFRPGSHAHTPSSYAGQNFYPQQPPSTPSSFQSHHSHTPSFSASTSSTPGSGLNASASSFSFQPNPNTQSFTPGAAAFTPAAQRTGSPAAFQIARSTPSKAIKIVKPPADFEQKKAEKEKAEKEKARLEKEAADKKAADEKAADQKVVDQKAADQKASDDKASAAKEDAEKKQKAEAEFKAAEEAAAKAKADAEADAQAKAQADEEAAAKKAAQDAEDAAAAKKKEDDERQQREKVEEETRKQEAEAKRVREQQEAEQKEKEEKEAAEAKKAADEEAALATAAAEKKQLEQEQSDAASAAKAEESASTPMSRQASSTASVDEPSTPSQDATAAPSTRKAAPEPLDLAAATKQGAISSESITAPGTALVEARIIEDLTAVTYPDNIHQVNAELNKSAKPGKFRYDRDFLLQFMEVCKEKPKQLPSLEALGMTDEGPPQSAGVGMPRSSSFGGKARNASGPIPQKGMPPAGLNRTVSSGFAGMGNFTASGHVPQTSAERFAQATAQQQAGGAPGGFGLPGRPGSMARTPSSTGGPGGIPMGGPSGRAGDRRSGRGARRAPAPQQSSSLIPSDFTPLEVSENRWTPTVAVTGGRPGAAGQNEDAPEFVERKVKALLNKLTIENFDSISKQILAWADKSAKETDGRILKQVIQLIFEKATDEQTWSAVYARLCLMLRSSVSEEVADESLIDEQTGKPTSGGRLFRRYLLTRCQIDYERGWAQKESATLAAKGKAKDDMSKKEAIQKEAEEAGADAAATEAAVKGADFSDEYYAAEKAKRRGLGLVRFIGELFKLNMLRQTIMQACIKKLIDNVDSPEEEDIESLCRLLTTVGKQLDDLPPDTNRQIMDIYFQRLQMIVDKKSVSSRLQYLILDLIDARKAGWALKAGAAPSGPKSIAQIHEDAQRQKEEEARRTASAGRGLPPRGSHGGIERGGSRRGQGREAGPDGWTNTAPSAPRPLAKAGDLASLGKIRSSSGSPAMFGPGRAKQATKEEQPAAPANPFALLAGGEDSQQQESAAAAESKPRRQPLKLAPRTVSTPTAGQAAGGEAEDGEIKEDEEEEAEEEEEETSGEVDEATKRSIDNSVKEYLAVKDIGEGKATFESLPSRHRGALAKAFIVKVSGSKPAEVESVVSLFKGVAEDSLVPSTDFRDAFVDTVTDLEDLATDAPKAFTFVGNLMAAAGLSQEDVDFLTQKMVSVEDELEEIQKRLNDAYSAAASVSSASTNANLGSH